MCAKGTWANGSASSCNGVGANDAPSLAGYSTCNAPAQVKYSNAYVCHACPPGYDCTNPFGATACSAGTYNDGTFSFCQTCPAG